MRGLFNDLWKFFVSVKLTVVILLTLAATSIFGTVIPQNQSPEAYVEAFGGFLFRLFTVFDIFDMYHSWWFQFFIGLLVLNIIVCSIDRISATRKILFPRKPLFAISRFENSANRRTFSTPRTPGDLREDFRRQIARHFGYVRVEDTKTGFHVLAEKGRWTRLGVYVVHASVVLLLVGAMIGSMFGFEGYVNIPEGETVDSIRLSNSDRMLRLPFSIRCDDFDVSYYPNRAPKEFRSSLSLLSGGKVIAQKDIIVNDPLRFQGINIFQSSLGEMPESRPGQQLPPPETVNLRFTSSQTGMAYERTTRLDEEVELPEELGRLLLTAYVPSATFMGQRIGQAVLGRLTAPDGTTAEVLLPVSFPNFDKMRKGSVVISVTGVTPAGGADAEAPREPEIWYYTGLQVTRDPGVWVVYAGFVLMICGCIITFFLGHKQLVVQVGAAESGSRVAVAGTTTRNKIGYDNRIGAIERELAERRDR